MTRSVIVTCCNHGATSSIALVSAAKAAALELFKHDCNAQLAKGRRAPAITTVGRFVDRRAPRLTRKIIKVFNAHRKKIAAKVSAAYKKKLQKASEEDLIDRILRDLELEGLSAEIIEEVKPDLIEAFKRSGVTAVTEVNVVATHDIVNLLDKGAVNYMKEHGAELIEELAGTTEKGIRRLLVEAVEKGKSPQDLATEIEELSSFGAERASTIARTELAFAHMQGNVEGWRGSGVVIGKEWLLGDLHDIDDECDDAAEAGIVPFEDEFSAGLDFPPAHPNCICAIRPITGGEEEQ